MAEKRPADLAARPLSFFWAWGVPMALMIASSFAPASVSTPLIVLVLSGCFLWMGVACAINARRCRRRHCFYSGPIFLMGAFAVLLVGFDILSLGQDGLAIVIGVTVALAVASYASEPIFGKYVRE